MSFKLDCKLKELLQEMLELVLWGFPNVTISLHIYISLLASVASGEHTFNVLRQVNKYGHSTMGQDRLNAFAMLNINCNLA